MDTPSIVYVVIAFILGAIIAFFLKKGGKNDESNLRISELTNENSTLRSKLSEAESKVKLVPCDSSKAVDDIKAKYEALLKEANEQSEKLTVQLKSALVAKSGGSIKEQLAEVEKLKKKIKDLEDDLEEKEDDVDNLKKKIRNKDTDISDLQECLGKEQKISKELKGELSLVKQALE